MCHKSFPLRTSQPQHFLLIRLNSFYPKFHLVSIKYSQYLRLKNLILFSEKEPKTSVKTFKDIENMLFEENRFNEMEGLYEGILSSMFHKYVFNRLVDIYLEKNDKDAAKELIEKFTKKHEESYIIKLNKIKLNTEDIELRKSLSEVCYSATLNEDTN